MKSQNAYVRSRVSEIKDAGLKVIYEKWFESDDEQFCYWMEIYLIDYFGRELLCNLTPGGEGPPSGEFHPSKDPRVRENIRKSKQGYMPIWVKDPERAKEIYKKSGESRRGEKSYFWGKHQSPETIQKRTRSGANHPNFGKHFSEETRAKQSASKMGKHLSAEHCAKLAAVWTGRKHTEESRAKMRAGWYNSHPPHTASEETKKKISASLRENPPFLGKKHTKESLLKMSVATKGRPGPNLGKKMSPEAVEKMRLTKIGKKRPPFTEETRRRMSEAKTGIKNGMYKHGMYVSA